MIYDRIRAYLRSGFDWRVKVGVNPPDYSASEILEAGRAAFDVVVVAPLKSGTGRGGHPLKSAATCRNSSPRTGWPILVTKNPCGTGLWFADEAGFVETSTARYTDTGVFPDIDFKKMCIEGVELCPPSPGAS